MKAKNLNKYTGWVVPDQETLKADFDEYKKKELKKWSSRAEQMGFRFPIFRTFNEFVQSAKSGKIIVFSPQDWNSIHNLTRVGSISALKDMVSGYQYPRDVDRIYHGMLNNDAIPMPIILKGSKGRWIMAGNTRANVASVLGAPVKALELDVSDERINESLFVTKRKGGVLPFYINGDEIQFMFMIPSDPNYGGTNPQIAKGEVDGGEDVQQTAFREAREELGLTKTNIENVLQPTSRRIPRNPPEAPYMLTVYGIKVKDKYMFAEPHYETGERMWLTLEQFQHQGQLEHLPFVQAVYQKAKRIYMKP